jgi:hypothetical protein
VAAKLFALQQVLLLLQELQVPREHQVQVGWSGGAAPACLSL